MSTRDFRTSGSAETSPYDLRHTSLVSLPAATAAMGVIGLAGAIGFIRWIPRYTPR